MRAAVVRTMASVRPSGFEQAARMLSHGDVRADVARLPAGMKVQVAFGDADAITTPEANRAVARSGIPVHVIPRGGHAVYLEKPERFNELLLRFVDAAGRPG
jgi:pimeloyl-ACP methyl ester carboxylesterase